MSHLSEFETEFTDKQALIRALCRVGFTLDQIETFTIPRRIVGYHSDEVKVGHIIIKKQNTGIPSDIGWEEKGGKFIYHGDDYNYGALGYGTNKRYDTAWQVNLLNYYNLEKSKMALEARGILCTECTDAKGRLQLRAKFKVKAKTTLRTSL